MSVDSLSPATPSGQVVIQWKCVGCHPCHSEFPTDQRIPAVIAAFCCLVELTSPVESKRKLVGAVGIEIASLLSKSNKGNGVARRPIPIGALWSQLPRSCLPCLCLIYLSASVRIGCYSTRSTLNFAGDSCRTNSNPFTSLPMPITVFGSIANCFSSVVFVFQ
jgi:hypothetical protein